MEDITDMEVHDLITVPFGEHCCLPAGIKKIPSCIEMIPSYVDPKKVKAEVIAQAEKGLKI